MDAIECYTELFALKDRGVDIVEQLRKIATSKNGIPQEVEDFINEQKGIDKKAVPSQLVEFIEVIRKKCNEKKSKLYKNLLDESLSLDEQVKSLNSYITHALIACEHIEDPKERIEFWRSSHVGEVAQSLSEYFNKGDSSIIKKTMNEIRADIKSAAPSKNQ